MIHQISIVKQKKWDINIYLIHTKINKSQKSKKLKNI